jgi:hypothetical protein
MSLSPGGQYHFLLSMQCLMLPMHNPSWLFGSDPVEAFETVRAKARGQGKANRAENHGFVWLSVMNH